MYILQIFTNNGEIEVVRAIGEMGVDNAQCRASYVSRSALEIFQKLWKHKGHSGNIKGYLSARVPLTFSNFEKL